MRVAEVGRECLGDKDGHHTVEVGRRDAQRNQREHVEAALPDGFDAAHKERPAAPEDDRCRQREFNPGGPSRVRDRSECGYVMPHRENEYGERQRQSDPEPPAHVEEFRIRTGIHRRLHRFQGHATNRAGARSDLSNLRVHGAGVNETRGRGTRRLFRLRDQVAWSIRAKLLKAFHAAENVLRAFERVAILGSRQRDRHPAYGIDRLAIWRGARGRAGGVRDRSRRGHRVNVAVRLRCFRHSHTGSLANGIPLSCGRPRLPARGGSRVRACSAPASDSRVTR